MTIRIAHLYYDIMNLYGEIGNIKVLRYHLEEQGIKVIIDNLSINDEIDFNKYDLLYDNGILVLEYSNDKLKDNLYFESLLPKYTPVIYLPTYDFNSLDQNMVKNINEPMCSLYTYLNVCIFKQSISPVSFPSTE